VLCIAKEGLADFTSIIWRCTDYAIKHNRSLIIDKTLYRSDPLSEIFDFTRWPVPVYSIDHLYRVDHTSVEPIEFQRYLKYENKRIIEVRYNGWMAFDMERIYPRDVLLVYSFKRDSYLLSQLFLQSVAYTADFTRFLKEQMSGLPPTYNVSHIRHTDYTVNLEATYQYIDRLMSSSPLPLYVATDNTSVLKTLIERYGSRVHYNRSILELSDLSGAKNLHDTERRFTLHNAILDLFILAKGANSVIEQYLECGSIPHGYTKTAEMLRSDTAFIDRLLV